MVSKNYVCTFTPIINNITYIQLEESHTYNASEVQVLGAYECASVMS